MATSLEELEVLNSVEGVADEIWRLTLEWDNYAKEMLGRQLARAADSIGANISEAFGRYHYGEKIRFLYFARGSLFETKYWLNRAASRELIASSKAALLAGDLNTIGRRLNAFVNSLKEQRQSSGKKQAGVAEAKFHYATSDELGDLPFLSERVLEWLSNPADLQSPISDL